MAATTTTTETTSWEEFRATVQAEVLARVPQHIQRLGWSAGRIEAAQRNGLRRLLAHATEHSPFHRRRLAGVDIDRIDPADLSSLPVMTKSEMMGALDEVFTDRRLSRRLIEEVLTATGTEPIPIHGEFIAMASGGSSGERRVRLRPAGGRRILLGAVQDAIGPAPSARRAATRRAAHRAGCRGLGRTRHWCRPGTHRRR
jgi:hypothetical protein